MTRGYATAVASAIVLAAAGLAIWLVPRCGDHPGAGSTPSGTAAAPGPRRMSAAAAGEGGMSLQLADAAAFDPALATPEERRNAPPPREVPPADASIYTPPRLAAVAEDAFEQIRELAAACAAKAKAPPAHDSSLRISYDLVIQGGAARIENLRVLDDAVGDATLSRCILDALAAARLRSVEEDQRISSDYTIPVGALPR